MARPNPPGVSSTPSGRGFLVLVANFARSFQKEARNWREAPAAQGKGERGRGEAHKAWVGSGSDRLERATRRRPGRGFWGVPVGSARLPTAQKSTAPAGQRRSPYTPNKESGDRRSMQGCDVTRSVNKAMDFVNGMEAWTQPPAACATATGKDLALSLSQTTMEDDGHVTRYPARPHPQAANTKLAHVTIWLDVRGFKAGGYVALSRVQCDTDCLLGGLLDPEHFAPAH